MIDISEGNWKTNIVSENSEGKAWRLVVSDGKYVWMQIEPRSVTKYDADIVWKTNIVREDSEGRAWRLVVSNGEYTWMQIEPRSITKYDAYIVFKKMEGGDESGQSDRAQS